jgi:hypothetical protein
VESDNLARAWEQFESCTGIDIAYEGSDTFEVELPRRVAVGTPPDLAGSGRPRACSGSPTSTARWLFVPGSGATSGPIPSRTTPPPGERGERVPGRALPLGGQHGHAACQDHRAGDQQHSDR